MHTQGSVADIYNAIFAGETVTLALSRQEFNSVRVALLKRHKIHKDLDISVDSVCARCVDGVATFWLGERASSRKTYTYATIRSDLGTAEESGT